MSSLLEQVKEAFAFLLPRGYAIVEEADEGMGGGVTYRSADVWIDVGWERDGGVSLEFASTHSSWYGRVPWDNIDHLLRGVARYEHEPPLFRTASLDTLTKFVRTNLTEIEERFAGERRDATASFLERLERDRRQRADDYWNRRVTPQAASSVTSSLETSSGERR